MKDLSEPFSAREIRVALHEYAVWLLHALTVKRFPDIVNLRIKEEESHGGARED